MIGYEIYWSIRDRINSSQIKELKFYALTTNMIIMLCNTDIERLNSSVV